MIRLFITVTILAACVVLFFGIACVSGGSPERAREPAVTQAPYCLEHESGRSSPVYRRIKAAVDEIRLIDTHEHLVSETLWLTHEVDFFYWFSHYSSSDLVSSGMKKEDLSFVRDAQNTPRERWSRMAAYWPFVKYTGYGQALRIAARDIYGVPDIAESTWSELSERISASQKPGFYEQLLRKHAGIDLVILDQIREDPYWSPESAVDNDPHPGYFVRVKRLDKFVTFDKGDIPEYEEQFGVKIETFDDMLAALKAAFAQVEAEGYVGLKSGLAYSRILRYEDTSREEAERAFGKIMAGETSFEQCRPYRDFMMHRIVKRAGELDLPFQIHTGLQEGNGNIITNSNPTHLVNLFLQYPDTRFDIFHGSFPYMGELAALAKNFRNVYLNMCWLPVISPTTSRLWLHQWLETVPANKIIAFGGDYLFPAGTYGHSVIVRRVVAETLTEKVEGGYLTEQEAVYIARRILRENAVDLFRLERFL